MECGALFGFGLNPDAAPMPLDDLFANGKPDAGAGIFAAGMQALKDKEDALEVLRLDADAIIVYTEMPGVRQVFHCYVDLRRAFAAELDGVADQVLEQLS